MDPEEISSITRPEIPLASVTVRFAGDSGDGIQLTGSQFTTSTALSGHDLATLPDFPAEIRAPAGTLPGVSGFQIQFSGSEVHTPGDAPDVLVAMNPAALRANLGDLRPGGLLVLNVDAFKTKDLDKAGYDRDPRENGLLAAYRVVPVELTRLTRASVEAIGLDNRSADRCKNLFALGMVYWLFERSMAPTETWLTQKFQDRPLLQEANLRALRAGWAFCEATELFTERYIIQRATVPPGLYRNISGNTALALGLIAAAHRSGLRLFYASYPITPASDVLHEIARHKEHGVVSFQAEDEIAAIGAALGAAYAGALGATCTSGPGMALKAETMGLATMVELPLVICDVQRGGPSTGLPTKTEQADLLMALYGRPSEAPTPVLAAATPADCFDMALEAARIAVRYMTPVVLLTDGYLANGAEPWRVPEVEDLPEFPVRFAEANGTFLPYARDEETLARPWAVPGVAGLEHRVGGLEKQDGTGNVNYTAENHERMVRVREEKIARIARDIPPQQVLGDPTGELVVVGWGSTYGAIGAAVEAARKAGRSVGQIHLRHLNPFPANLGDLLAQFEQILVVEMNLGQLAFLLRARYGVTTESLNKVQGKPFAEGEVLARILASTTAGGTR